MSERAVYQEFQLKEYPNQVYSISTKECLKRDQEGGAIMQSYLVAGKAAVLVIDGPAPAIPGLRAYVEELFGVPAWMLNTHGHVDHIGCNDQFDWVYIAKEDWSLAAGGGIQRIAEKDVHGKLAYQLKDLQELQIINLGNRELQVIKIPGHTKGSVLLWEEETGILFSGDSIARRILYGMSDSIPLSEYLKVLEKVDTLAINVIYSMHDDFALPADMARQIIDHIKEELPFSNTKWVSPVDGREFIRLTSGKSESDPGFFDMVIPENLRNTGRVR